MAYTHEAAHTFVCALRKVLEEYDSISTQKANLQEILNDREKWLALPCGEKVRINREFLVAEANAENFREGADQRKKDIKALLSELKKTYEAQQTAINNELALVTGLEATYNKWESAPQMYATLSDGIRVAEKYFSTIADEE